MFTTKLINAIRLRQLLVSVTLTATWPLNPTAFAAELEFCLTFPTAGVFELWIRGAENIDQAGVAGFSVPGATTMSR
jgi:hypothetical protein